MRDSSDWSDRDRENPRARRTPKANEPGDKDRAARSDFVWPPDPRQSSTNAKSSSDIWPTDSTDPGDRLRPKRTSPPSREPESDLPRPPRHAPAGKTTRAPKTSRSPAPSQTGVRRAVSPRAVHAASRPNQKAAPTAKSRARHSAPPGRTSSGRGPAWFQACVRGVRRVPSPIRWTLVGIIALICLSMIIDASVFYGKIHAGITIAGQSVSGLTQDEATSLINTFVEESQTRPVKLLSDEKDWEVYPASMGAHIDVGAAVTAAMGITRDNFHVVDLVKKLELYFAGQDVPLVGTVDSASLDALMDEIAEELDEPAVNSALVVRGLSVSAIKAKQGLVVDKETLKRELTDTLISLHSTEIEIPMMVDEPEVLAQDFEEAVTKTRTMISAPITLVHGEDSWTFTTQQIASFLDFTSSGTSDSSTLVPYLSAEKMGEDLEEIAAQSVAEPVDAYFVADGDKAVLMPAVEGVILDAEQTAENLTLAALSTSDRSAEVAGEKQEPDLTTAEAEAMGITDLLGTKHIYVHPNDTIETINSRELRNDSTYRAYNRDAGGSNTNRRINVQMTLKYATKQGALYIAPGEEFNFLETVGPRTPERGFVKAYGIEPGIELEPVYGGGICEISTAFFNAALFSGLKIVERRNHSLFFWHYPYGQDATVTDNGPNLRFVNNTDHYIWITGVTDGRETEIYVYGTDDGREVKLDVSDWYGVAGPYTRTTLDPRLPTGVTRLLDPGTKAKMIMVTRTISWPNGRTETNQFESNYKHTYRIVRVGTGTTTTTTAPPTTVAP